MTLPIYLDYQSTTPLAPQAREAMQPYLHREFGNPASHHAYGFRAERAVQQARQQIAQLLHAQSNEIIFTSGATESNNLALKGYAYKHLERCKAQGINGPQRSKIIVSAIEHMSVLQTALDLEWLGFDIVQAPVSRQGIVDLDWLKREIDQTTLLVSLMAVNNEIGTIQPVSACAELAHTVGALLHCDAAQAVGKIPFAAPLSGADLITISSHKMYGPKGVGALFLRSGEPVVRLHCLHSGSGHESGLRSGTLNVAAIVGFGAAAELAANEGETHADRLRELRDHFLQRLQSELQGVQVHGSLEQRCPNNLSLSFTEVEAATLLMQLSETLCCSGGSACLSMEGDISHVLQAIGCSEEEARGALRLSFGRPTTRDEVDAAAASMIEQVHTLRQTPTTQSGGKEQAI